MTNIELETLGVVKRAANKYAQPKQIDWEQRRYEIAKDLFVHHETMTAEGAVKTAEILIVELKKKGTEND